MRYKKYTCKNVLNNVFLSIFLGKSHIKVSLAHWLRYETIIIWYNINANDSLSIIYMYMYLTSSWLKNKWTLLLPMLDLMYNLAFL